MISSILSVLKVILDLAAYSALIILVYVFIYVRSGHSITLQYIEDDEDDDNYIDNTTDSNEEN